ncbi:MAG: High-affnity carbon uptake protein Hat/HatR [Gemmataceae bacterium]|nr:High-affnity carbon uptake protein Hat/HatR [Gemmataceae bacterium]
MAHTFALVWAVATLAAPVAVARADDDPIRDKLAAAKTEYEMELLRLRTVLRESMTKAEDAARATGNKPVVDKVKADRKVFEESGRAPGTTAGASYNKGLLAARHKLEAAYKQAAVEYVKAKKDAESDAVEQEMKEFLAAKPGGVTPNAAAKDPYQIGTIWAGELKWNGDPGNHNYLFVITERAGKTFKGIARLDYGPSGEPKRKAIYDIEGEIDGLNLKYKGDLEGLNEVGAKWNQGALEINATATNGGALTGSLRPKK